MTQNVFLGVDAAGLPEHFQELKARIDVFDEAILYTRFNGDGQVKASYQVAPGDLAAALSGVPVTTGLLPRDCLFYSRAGGQERIAVYLPAAVRDLAVITQAGREDLTVPTPPLVFLGQGTVYSVWAVKQRPGRDDRLYRAPFPNISLGGGRICQGDAEFPACAPGTIHRAAAAFFESRFNEHLVNGKSDGYGDDVLPLWRVLHEAAETDYPLDDLVGTRHLLSHLVGGKL